MKRFGNRTAGKLEFPDGKRFAFSILDDTDDTTVENVKPIYGLLEELGFRTTKTVWPLDCPEGSRLYFAAQTLRDKPYLEFVHGLAKKGFEITWHCATMESSERGRTIEGLESFHREFGFYPKVHCNHGQNRENIYWGRKRYQSALVRTLARLVRVAGTPEFSGEVESSPYFWGDLCQRHFTFVRNFTFYEINVLKCCPYFPYRLRSTPFVNYWFPTSDAPDVEAFNRLLTRDGLDTLCQESGVSIISTHLGKGFCKNGQPNRQTADILRYLATLPGWFVPASDILGFLMAANRHAELGAVDLMKLELRHAADRMQGRIKSWRRPNRVRGSLEAPKKTES